ncbi:hypothetical protein CBE01nite_09000 [Clostridium beijerinckii]|uniref:DUF1659 domain-containing protein n=1 Tax=Clostridium beijerinckii TaxID=1520 RepID=A0AB74VI28_CLOBE|nr:DUF1659 domain-containing protein [Clostridium beijerinckii]NRZ25365.1 hypothetical protein [Clostridium beijerinckii]NYB97882.1 hypothetical protein [Clostridium beijerinckii]OOM25864.1 hypothetical protein CLBEI_13810 [Clostridium beijerinckii]QUN36136.1 DUF1659 domain-containing protein [Clostridium beijerinckii]SQB13167.1 Protein of uncharacterised function (DUF1659) [Clostridium beijerinckii]
MAVTKVMNSATLSIEVQKGTDKAGDPIYSKKSFSNVRINADAQNVYEVAEAIKLVLDASTRDSFITESSSLINA